jgi:adhesin transport system outer membrane protein
MAANQDLAAARIEFSREVQRLYLTRALQARLIELKTRSLDDLESLLASYKRQYETGSKSWLDLMNMQRELFSERRDLLQTQIDWQMYSLQLLAKIGGLDPLAGIDERSRER